MILLNTLIPVFALIVLGLASRHAGLFKGEAVGVLNAFILYICLPPLFFWSTASVDIRHIINLRFIGVICASAWICGLIAWFVMAKVRPDSDSAGRLLVSLCTLNPNTIYIGIPLFTLLFGSNGTTPVIVASLCFNILFMGLSMTVLDHLTSSSKRSLGQLLIQLLVKNPLFVPPMIGTLWSLLGLPTPQALGSTMSLLAQATAPVALFTMGLTLYGQKVRGNIAMLSGFALMKLLLHPALALLLGYFVLPLSSDMLKAALMTCALPTAAMVSLFALRYDREVQTISSITVITTVLAIFSLSIWIALLDVLPAR